MRRPLRPLVQTCLELPGNRYYSLQDNSGKVYLLYHDTGVENALRLWTWHGGDAWDGPWELPGLCLPPAAAVYKPIWPAAARRPRLAAPDPLRGGGSFAVQDGAGHWQLLWLDGGGAAEQTPLEPAWGTPIRFSRFPGGDYLLQTEEGDSLRRADGTEKRRTDRALRNTADARELWRQESPAALRLEGRSTLLHPGSLFRAEALADGSVLILRAEADGSCRAELADGGGEPLRGLRGGKFQLRCPPLVSRRDGGWQVEFCRIHRSVGGERPAFFRVELDENWLRTAQQELTVLPAGGLWNYRFFAGGVLLHLLNFEHPDFLRWLPFDGSPVALDLGAVQSGRTGYPYGLHRRENGEFAAVLERRRNARRISVAGFSPEGHLRWESGIRCENGRAEAYFFGGKCAVISSDGQTAAASILTLP